MARALDGLTAWQLTLAEGLAALPDPARWPTGRARSAPTRRMLPPRSPSSGRRALVWGTDDVLHLVRAVRDQFGAYPGGLAPPSSRPCGAREIDALLAECEPAARTVLDRLLWNPTGAVAGADRMIDIAAARTPVEKLLARRLLAPLDAVTP